jgi:hypothetical protein
LPKCPPTSAEAGERSERQSFFDLRKSGFLKWCSGQ